MRQFFVVAALVLWFAIPGGAQAQWLYFGEPGNCAAWFDASLFRGTWRIVLHAPDLPDATGATFRLESDSYGPEDEVTILAASGVTVAGDLLQGMAVAWTPRPLDHASLMTLTFTDNPPARGPGGYYLAFTRDVVVTLSGGGSLELEDVGTELVHCQGGGSILFHRPDTALATVGKTTIVAFEGIGQTEQWGPAVTNISASDEAGWAVAITPTFLWGNCGTCPWFWSTFELTVQVPPGTSQGALSHVTLQAPGAGTLTQFTLKAVAPVGVNEKTWGTIKALYAN